MSRVFLLILVTITFALAACGGETPWSEPTPQRSATARADDPYHYQWCRTTADCEVPVRGITNPCGGDCACEATSPRTSPTTVSVLPDAGEKPFVDILKGAQFSIRVMVYLMGYGGILDALKAKAQAGVDVRVILDQGKVSVNQKYHDQLVAAGAQVLWSDPKFPYMHAKAIIVDEKEAVLTTGNFSKKYSIDRERNFVARVTDPEDLADLVAIFEADWKRGSLDLSCTRLLVSPINARQRILALIDSATNTLTIESMQFADKEVRSHVAARKTEGVLVRAILADPSWISANKTGAAFLVSQGIEVRWIPHCHTKAIIADNTRAYLGSENLSYTSLSKNREVGLVLTEPGAVKVLTDTFELDWPKGTPF